MVTHQKQTDRKGNGHYLKDHWMHISVIFQPNYTAISVHLSDYIFIATGDEPMKVFTGQ